MSIYDTHKPPTSEGGGLYLKIQDGETVRLRIASEPAIFEQESKPDEEGKVRLSTRYGWVVFNQDTKQAQILQQSATFFKSIAALAQDEEWGDPTGYDIKITRQGSSLETTYNVMPSANREPLSENAKELVDAINLIEKLEASPFSQRVMWLSKFDELAAEPASTAASRAPKAETVEDSPGKASARATADRIKQGKPAKKEEEDVVIEDIGDEPVNLDDIPF